MGSVDLYCTDFVLGPSCYPLESTAFQAVVSLRFRDLHGPVIAFPCVQGVAQQFLNFWPLPQGQ